MHRNFLRGMIWAAVSLQAVLMTAALVLQMLTPPSAASSGAATQNSGLVSFISVLVFPVVGVIIFTRRPGHPVGWLFCVAMFGWALNDAAIALANYALQVTSSLLPLARSLVWFCTWSGSISSGLILLLLLLFPDGRLPSTRWKPAAWAIAAYMVIFALASAFAPGLANDSLPAAFINPLGIGGSLGVLFQSLGNISGIVFFILAAVAAASLVLRFRSVQGAARQQIKWLATSIVLFCLLLPLAILMIFLYPVGARTPFWAPLVVQITFLSLSLVPVATGIAILRYRLYEIDRIINQALVYTSLTVILALLYFGLVVLLQTLFSAITGEGQSAAAAVISTLALASLFTPLRRRIQALIDQRFYRRKYNAEQILARLSGSLRNEVDLDVMSAQIVAIIDEALQPERTMLWLRTRK